MGIDEEYIELMNFGQVMYKWNADGTREHIPRAVWDVQYKELTKTAADVTSADLTNGDE